MEHGGESLRARGIPYFENVCGNCSARLDRADPAAPCMPVPRAEVALRYLCARALFEWSDGVAADHLAAAGWLMVARCLRMAAVIVAGISTGAARHSVHLVYHYGGDGNDQCSLQLAGWFVTEGSRR